MIIPDGSLIQNTTIPAVDTNPTIAGDGCTFVNVVFHNPTQFGAGCTFVNCTFVDLHNKFNTLPHVTGNANTFQNCQFNYVHFGENNVSDLPPKGYRPNVIGVNMLIGPQKKYSPAVSSKHTCNKCGHLLVAHQGSKVVESNLYTKSGEHAGGRDVDSNGICGCN